jgi:hypothetical protein
MHDENPENLPLAERINKAEYFARELAEHLQLAFLPKLSQLRVSSKKPDPEEVTDQTMYDQMAAVVNAEEYASNLYTRLKKYLESIQKDAAKAFEIVPAPAEVKEFEVLVDIQDIVLE